MSQNTPARRLPANPQGTIDLELEIHARALEQYRQHSLDLTGQLVFAYGVIADCIADPQQVYSRDQLNAVLRGLDRSRTTYAGETS